MKKYQFLKVNEDDYQMLKANAPEVTCIALECSPP
jgi:hypothetical protein